MRAFLCALVRAWYRRMKYRRDGKGKLAIGVYPEVSLKEAGEARDQARAKLRAGHGPSEHKQLSKLTPKLSVDTRFQTIAMDWLESRGTWRSQRGRRRHGCWRPTPSFGWQSARSMKSAPLRCWQYCVGWRLRRRSSPRSAFANSVGRYFATPWPPEGQIETRPVLFGGNPPLCLGLVWADFSTFERPKKLGGGHAPKTTAWWPEARAGAEVDAPSVAVKDWLGHGSLSGGTGADLRKLYKDKLALVMNFSFFLESVIGCGRFSRFLPMRVTFSITGERHEAAADL